jgi:hypothetical protein
VELEPTASHEVGEAHDTPLRILTPGGRLWVDHEVPFQPRATPLEELEPTASHEFADVHDTPLSPNIPEGML